jgi:drug/metabolite transporter (DMT)-like permease
MPVILVALGSALWGTDTVLRLPLTAHLASATIVFYEHLIICVIAIPVLAGAREELRTWQWKHWLALLGIAWGGSALATVLFTEALSRGNPTTAILLQKCQPLFTFLLAGPLLGERLTRRHWGYLAAGASGAWLVSFGANGGVTGLLPAIPRVEATAALLALGASALWGTSTVLGRFLSPQSSFPTVTALRFVVALPMLFAITQLTGVALPVPNSNETMRLVTMALVPGLAALLLYYRGLQGTPAALAAIAELCFPTTALILNWLFLNQHPAALQIAGFLVIWIVVWRLQAVGRSTS